MQSDFIGLWLAALISLGLATFEIPELYSCLGGIDASFKGDASYANATFYWNRRLKSPQPAAVLRPVNEQQIQKIVKCASGKTTVSVRSGGHSYEGYWQGNKDGIVVDLQNMNQVIVDKEEKKVRVGAGTLLGRALAKLWKADKGALPHGVQSPVGMGGMTLGGGFGMLSRNYGLLVDRVTEMKMVDYKGQLLTVNEQENSDLFFALRGAGGGSFGVVTEFTYSYIKMNQNVTVARYVWTATKETFTPIVKSLMAYYDSNPPNGASHCLILSTGGRIDFEVTYSDEPEAHPSHIQNLGNIVSKGFDQEVQSLEFFDAFRFFAGTGGTPDTSTLEEYENSQPLNFSFNFKGRSGYLNKNLDEMTIDQLRDFLVHPGSPIFLLIELLGGAIAQKKGTSFTHRDMFASVQVGGLTVDTFPTVNAIYDILHPKFHGAYQNYMDVNQTNFLDSYYPGIGNRLIEIKSKYDPIDTFKFERSIPLNTSDITS